LQDAAGYSNKNPLLCKLLPTNSLGAQQPHVSGRRRRRDANRPLRGVGFPDSLLPIHLLAPNMHRVWAAMSEGIAGKRVLITSGPTRANIDAVRFISNRSTGRLGARMATEALALGARVTMVAGPQSATPRRKDFSDEEWRRLRLIHIETVFDLLGTLERELTGPETCDAVIHAMAVLDYVPQEQGDEKTPSGRNALTLTLVKTPKVIQRIKDWAPDALLVGFKLEKGKSEQRLREIALASLRKNRADLVVANDMDRIRDETHPALIVSPGGKIVARPGTKSEIARELCRIIGAALGS